MRNFFDASDYQQFVQRLEHLQPDQRPKWGKMTPAQMLAHCTETQEACNGKALRNTPFYVKLFKGFIKKSVKPYAPRVERSRKARPTQNPHTTNISSARPCTRPNLLPNSPEFRRLSSLL